MKKETFNIYEFGDHVTYSRKVFRFGEDPEIIKCPAVVLCASSINSDLLIHYDIMAVDPDDTRPYEVNQVSFEDLSRGWPS